MNAHLDHQLHQRQRPPLGAAAPITPQPAMQPSAPNVFAEVQDTTQAGDIFGRLGDFQARDVAAPEAYTPERVAAGQLAATDYGQYMSPYTQEVIERGQADIERQRQLASENLAARAQRARAFGGSRQGVQEGILAGEYGRMAGDFAAQQRQRAFEQAQQTAQYDIGQRYAADLASQAAFQRQSSIWCPATVAGSIGKSGGRYIWRWGSVGRCTWPNRSWCTDVWSGNDCTRSYRTTSGVPAWHSAKAYR